MKVWALQVEPTGAPKSRPRGTKRAKVGLEKVIKGVWKAKVVAIDLDCLFELWKLTEIDGNRDFLQTRRS